MKKKKVTAILLTTVMAGSLLASCGSSSSSSGSSAASSNSAAASAASATSDSAADDYGPKYDEWSEKTDDELYEEAQKEKGQINVYATSSKMLKVEEAFEKAYPGLDLVVSDMDNDEVLEKCKVENETGNVTGDVLQTKDSSGNVFYEYYEDGIIDEYYPKDICEKIDPAILKYGYPLYASQSFWFYNTDAFPDGQPISSWWNIVEKNDDGSQKYRIFTKEIGQESTYLALFTSFIQNADELEKDYKDTYGKDLDYTYDGSEFDFDVPENNAGVELLYRFSQLKMTFIGDGDELTKAVAESTKDDPALALCSAGKIENRDESGYPIAWCTGLTPYTGLENIEYMYPVDGCDNPAGARLFIRWITGGTDGKSEGYEVFKKEGNWPVRSDITNDKNPVENLSDTGAIAPDISFIYEHFYDAQDMWTYWLDQNPNM